MRDGHQPVRADAGRGRRCCEAIAREGARPLRLRGRSAGVGDGHFGRHRGAVLRDPRGRAAGRRGHPARAGVRLLRAGGRAGRRARRARPAAAAVASASTGTGCATRSRRARGSSSSTRRTIRRGAVLGAADLDALADVLRDNGVLVLSDEVYEHIVFDGRQHLSLLARPSLAARSFVVSSFGKTLHCTGWKVGYCVAPPALTTEFRKVHQFVHVRSGAPMQVGTGAIPRRMPAACPRTGAVLPAQARSFLPAARGHRVALRAEQRHVLPARRLRDGRVTCRTSTSRAG